VVALINRPQRRAGFSLIELVIVAVIIGIVAAIAIPRIGTSSAAANEAAFKSNLSLLREAIDRYAADHTGAFPTCDALGGNKTTIMLQLTQYTDDAGNYSASKSSTHQFGPYLREIPALTVGGRKGQAKISTSDGSTVGWVYSPVTGSLTGNTEGAVDKLGRAYASY
jgi:prepilin-type N-terminal cleavage/methylation domain-containing protein